MGKVTLLPRSTLHPGKWLRPFVRRHYRMAAHRVTAIYDGALPMPHNVGRSVPETTSSRTKTCFPSSGSMVQVDCGSGMLTRSTCTFGYCAFWLSAVGGGGG